MSSTFTSIVSTFHPSPRTESIDREVEQEEYIQRAKDFMQFKEHATSSSSNPTISKKHLSIPDKLFVDFAYSYANRLTKLESFWSLDADRVYRALCEGLSDTFNLISSKVWQYDDQNRATPSFGISFSFLIWLITLIVPIVSIGLCHSSQKEDYSGIDIKVTFILLYITYFLEFATILTWRYYASNEWSNLVFQHNLIGFLAYKERHKKLMTIADCIQSKAFLGQHEPCYSSKDITNLVSAHAKDGWVNYIMDVQSYWKFSDNQGHWTLERNECEDIVIRSSIEKPFDESIILWHLATDFCFRHKDASLESDECAKPCQQISNYMMHLLFDNPEMLPNSRRVLSTAAYEELEDILQGDDVSFLDEKELTQEIIGKAEFAECGFIRDAWILAEELKQLGDEKKMWEIIKGVWIEILCFSAGRCRGYLHAKSLGTGGEYLTVVSLVMSHAGLETFAERQQRVQLRLSKEERVRIARQRIEAERNQACSIS